MRRPFPTRAAIQLGFIVLVGVGVFVLEGNAERWCPFGGAEAIYTYVHEGNLPCSLQVSNFFMLGGVLLSVLLFRRAFCGYACPVGAISEWTHRLGRAVGLKTRNVPRAVDTVLSVVKYLVLALLLVLTWRTGELVFRGYDPCYALISRHGEDITFWAYVVSGALLLASMVWSVPFCRWLCPLGALLNPFSRFAWWRVKRSDIDCSGCSMCSRVCPMEIPVDQVEEVTHARCTACLECVSACPRSSRGALEVRTRHPRPLIVGGLLLLLAAPVAASFLLPLPSFRWSKGGAEPEKTVTLELEMEGLTCRGSANLLVYFLTRDDDLELPGYVALDAWPGPGVARAQVSFDPALCDEDAVRAAITEPYFEPDWQSFRHSDFRIVGYDPFGAPR